MWLATGVGLLSAQTAGVWHWFTYDTQSAAEPTAAWLGTGAPYQRMMGETVVVGDTVYILATVQHAQASNPFFPPGALSGWGVQNDNDTRAVLLAYNRHDGTLLWQASFHPYYTLGDPTHVRGIDLWVTPDHTLYVLLHARAYGSGQVLGITLAYGGTTVIVSPGPPAPITSGNDIPEYPMSFIFRMQMGTGNPNPTSYALQQVKCRFIAAFNCDNFEANLFSLLLHEGKLWASGTVVTKGSLSPEHNSVELSQITSSLNSTIDALFSLVTGYPPTAQALLLRMDPFSLTADSAAVVQDNLSFGGIPAGCFGRALLAFGPDTLGWLVANREQGTNIRYKVAGSSVGTGVSSEPKLRLLLIKGSTMQLVPVPAGTHYTLAEYASSISESATHYFVAFQSITQSGTFRYLYWAAVDTAGYTIGATTLPQAARPRLILTGMQFQPNLLPNRLPVVTAEADSLQLTGLAIEPLTSLSGQPTSYLYLSGIVKSPSWSLTNVTNAPAALPGGTGSEANGFILGLRYYRTPSPADWRFGGYKVLGTLASQGPRQGIMCASLAKHPTRPSLYLFGWGRDSVLVEPRWDDGHSDTLSLQTAPGGVPRIWVGRLDLHRLDLGPVMPIASSACAPDSLPNQQLGITGTWAATHRRELLWMPEDPARRYRATQPWAGSLARDFPAIDIEGSTSGSVDLLLSGRMPPGRYFLVLRSSLLGRNFADVGDTLWVQVSGTTTPLAQRAGSLGDRFWVFRYVGSDNANAPPARWATGPFHRKARSFDVIHGVAYVPWDPHAGGKECLYILERTFANDSAFLYRVTLHDGQVVRLRAWKIGTTSSSETTVRLPGSLVPGPSGGSLLRYDVLRGNLFLREVGALRLIRLDTGPDLIFSTIPSPPTPPEAPTVFASSGNFFYQAYNAGLWRWGPPVAPPSQILQDATYPPCDPTRIGAIRAITAHKDTLYWIENACSNADLLRKAVPTSSTPPYGYVISTIDTLRRPGSSFVSHELAVVEGPRPMLLVGYPSTGGATVLRYDLSTGVKDTLFFGGSCGIEGPNWDIRMDYWAIGLTTLRGGSIAFSHHGARGVMLAVPLWASYFTQDTLQAEAPITGTGGPIFYAGHSGDRLYLNPSAQWYSGTGFGLDSGQVSFSIAPCSPGKLFSYWGYRIPLVGTALYAPDTLCVGALSGTRADTLFYGTGYGGTVCNWPTFSLSSTQGRVLIDNARGPGMPTSAWWIRGIAPGPDTLILGTSNPKASFLIGASGALRKPILVRRGHRIRFRAALEGPATRGCSGCLQPPHPYLTPATFFTYLRMPSATLTDSLWRLPAWPWEADSFLWRRQDFSSPPNYIIPTFSLGSAIARVEAYDAATHQRIDTAWAVIDTLGHLYPFTSAYPLPLTTYTGGRIYGDTLSFCVCDTNAAKYFVLRTPNHLPLYTAVVSLPARGVGEADTFDLTDPSSLQGVPGQQYKLIAGPGGRMYAATWAGNCADQLNDFGPGQGLGYDRGGINAADWEFLLPRSGITAGFSWADLDADGDVDAADALLLRSNQNALRQSAGP